MSDQNGKIIWSELMTRDVAASKAYYTEVYGYKFETVDMGQGDYHVGRLGGEMAIGVFDITDMPGMEDMAAQWMTYFAVDDVDKAAAATKAAGGTIIQEPMDIDGVGRVAMAIDPGGAMMGIMTPSDPPQ